MNHYPRHIGDYNNDAGHLSLLQHGVYVRLLDRYYSTEKGIPDDKKYSWLMARTDDECAAVDAVLNEFFTLEDGHWVQHRCEREIDAYRGRVESAQQNGKRGGRPRKTESEPKANQTGSNEKPKITDPVFSANPNITESLTNQNQNHKPDTPNGVDTHGPGHPDLKLVETIPPFEPWWAKVVDTYPKRSGGTNRAKCEDDMRKRWKSIHCDAEKILEGLTKYAAWCDATGKTRTELVQQMTTWFNRRGWTEEYEIPDQQTRGATTGRPTVETAQQRADRLGDFLGVPR